MCFGQSPPQGSQLEQSNPVRSHELATVSEQASTTPHCRQTHVRHHSHTNLHEQTSSYSGTATCCSVYALLLLRKRSRALEDCMAHLPDCNELTDSSLGQSQNPKPYSSVLLSCLRDCNCSYKHSGIYQRRDCELGRSSTTALLALAQLHAFHMALPKAYLPDSSATMWSPSCFRYGSRRVM